MANMSTTPKSARRILFFLLLVSSTIKAQTGEEVVVTSKSHKLAASWINPSNKANTAVLFISGSGPTDRDGNSAVMKPSNYIRYMADSLAQKGIASLRYDKYGVGKSLDSNIKEENLRFTDFVDDAVSAIRFIRAQKGIQRIIVAGHSEGSLVGMLAIQQEPTEGFISIAGAGQPADSLILEQLKSQPPFVYEASAMVFDSLRHGKLVPDVATVLYSLFRPSVQPYMISWIRYNPRVEIAKLKCKTLIINGTTDLQTSEAEAKRLHSGKPDARLAIIDGMNHVLREAPIDRKGNIETYEKAELPLHPGLMKSIYESGVLNP